MITPDLGGLNGNLSVSTLIILTVNFLFLEDKKFFSKIINLITKAKLNNKQLAFYNNFIGDLNIKFNRYFSCYYIIF